MDSNLADQGLKLIYLHQPARIDSFDPGPIIDDLCDNAAATGMLPWRDGRRICDSDHLVLATGRGDGRCVGLLAGSDMATEREPFLFLDTAYIAHVSRAAHLLHRMLAFAMLRIAGLATVPTVLAGCVQTPSFARALCDFGTHFSNAVVFPATPSEVVIDLGMASQARRIARTVRPGSRGEAAFTMLRAGKLDDDEAYRMEDSLVVVDLSAANEATLLDEALKLYRARVTHGARRGLVHAMAGAVSHTRRRLRAT